MYIAGTQPSPESVAMLIPSNFPIRQLSDLKGKKVAFTKGFSAHYVVVKALASAKLRPDDVQNVYLLMSQGDSQAQADAVREPTFA